MSYMLMPAHQPLPGTELVQRLDISSGGLSGCGCGGKCKGMGIFDGGPASWSWQEWALTGIGVYALFSIVFTTKSGVRAVGEGVRGKVRRTRRRIGSRVAGRELA